MARALHWTIVMRPSFFAIALLSFAFAGMGCGGDTYCQSGPKYGTQCHSMSDVRNPPGPRPPAGEPPHWWSAPPPPVSYGAAQAKPAPPLPPPPTSSTLQRDGGTN